MFLKTEERPQGEPAIQRGKLKLSEALSMSDEPLCRSMAFTTRACAMMSAYEIASGAQRGSYSWTDVEDFWSATVPVSIVLQCAGMNDNGASRKEIADWLASQGL